MGGLVDVGANDPAAGTAVGDGGQVDPVLAGEPRTVLRQPGLVLEKGELREEPRSVLDDPQRAVVTAPRLRLNLRHQ